MRKTPLLVSAIFRDVQTRPFPEARDIVAGEIAFVVTTFDVLIKRGDWLVLGEEIAVELPELVFKISQSTFENAVLENFDRSRSRPATRDEIMTVPYRTSLSPKAVESMFGALDGRAEWDAEYDGYTIESIRRRAKLLD